MGKLTPPKHPGSKPRPTALIQGGDPHKHLPTQGFAAASTREGSGRSFSPGQASGASAPGGGCGRRKTARCSQAPAAAHLVQLLQVVPDGCAALDGLDRLVKLPPRVLSVVVRQPRPVCGERGSTAARGRARPGHRGRARPGQPGAAGSGPAGARGRGGAGPRRAAAPRRDSAGTNKAGRGAGTGPAGQPREALSERAPRRLPRSLAPHRSAPTSEVLDDQLPGAARAPRFGGATGQRRGLREAVGAAHESRDAALPRALVRHGWAGRRPAPRRPAPPPAQRPVRARPAPPPPPPPPVGLRP